LSPTRPIGATGLLTVQIAIPESLSLFRFSSYVEFIKTFETFEGVVLKSDSTVGLFFSCLQPSSFDFVGTINDLLLEMTGQAMSYDLTSIPRQAFLKEIGVTKDLTKNSEMPLVRMSMTVQYLTPFSLTYIFPHCSACHWENCSSVTISISTAAPRVV
jgi:hypothetical protein